MEARHQSLRQDRSRAWPHPYPAPLARSPPRWVTVWTAATDKNQLLGRPGGYTTAATITDKRVSCTPDPDTSCGATVEVYPTEGEALARSQYIQSVLSGGGLLGTEYHTIQGSALLRVTGQLTPEQAKVYADKFKAAAQR